ncbi:hypothetical protein OG978_33535 [Streptomyces sp. NBC_01591]|uniref:hypothetical protein n=1 Tax=Streptomyces sp. NBC_01591 TaxID=2975888 RepID=UPI002DD8BC0A|nr:hypothetical protein [Streptomyces sp. NBC_01591]WSD71884.1 hypothetical protein OG978_33535 [Streptomyces sp. NBC_01591]
MSIIPSAAPNNTSPTDRAAAHFAADFAEATIKSRREDGLYRHVEFAAPKTMSRLILVTWPYNLLVAGSHGSYHFERFGDDTEDMFAWLRGIRVDPDRWASKLVNGADSVREYDRDRMEAQIKERVTEAVEDAWAPDGLEAAVRIEILNNHLLGSRDTAFQLVSEFEHGVKYEAKCTCGTKVERDSYGSALTWRSIDHNLGDDHDVDIRQTAGFDFDDLSEWSVDRVSYHFAYQCHAASWAIAQYDAAPKAVAA